MDDNHSHSVCPFPACQRNYKNLRQHLVGIRQKGGDKLHPLEDGIWVTLKMNDIDLRDFRCPFADCSAVYLRKHSLKEHLIILLRNGGDALHPQDSQLWNDKCIKSLLSIVPGIRPSTQSTTAERAAKEKARRKRYRQKRRERLHGSHDSVDGMYIYSLEY